MEGRVKNSFPDQPKEQRAVAKILVCARTPEEREFLYDTCRTAGVVYAAPGPEKAQALLDAIPFSIALVEVEDAMRPPLRDRLEALPVLFLTGRDEERLRAAARAWPAGRFVDIVPISKHPLDRARLEQKMRAAGEYLRLRTDADSMAVAKADAEGRLKKVYGEIKGLNSALSEGLLKEMEKRVVLQERYLRSEQLKRRFEGLLRRLYAADDMNVLMDMVPDIKALVGASGLSLYILEENDSLGRYLKPLIWEDAFLAHADFSRHVALLPSQDFAAHVARTGEVLNLTDPMRDARASIRYRDLLAAPPRSLLAAPLQHGRDVIGVLEVYNKTPEAGPGHGFTAEDRQVLRGLSEHISLALTKLNLIQYDALTGLLRPDPFFEKVVQKVETLSKRRQETGSFALVMGDVDWFKAYNDRNGHEAGNRLLRDLGAILRASIRDQDLLCRYGGEEFLFFLTGVKNIEEATLLTERIRKSVEEHVFEFEEFQPRHNLTMSFGVTLVPMERAGASSILTRASLKMFAQEADLALAEAKGKKLAALGGDARLIHKNRVCAYVREKAAVMSKTTILRSAGDRVYMEKRSHARYAASTLCIFRENGSHRVATTVDLSLGGARISVESAFPLARVLDLFMVLGNRACPFRGEVVYCQKASPNSAFFYTGLKFRDLTSGDNRLLEAYFLSLGKKDGLGS
jgi:diguanylate cyclase (GGDEF)-like protein